MDVVSAEYIDKALHSAHRCAKSMIVVGIITAVMGGLVYVLTPPEGQADPGDLGAAIGFFGMVSGLSLVLAQIAPMRLCGHARRILAATDITDSSLPPRA